MSVLCINQKRGSRMTTTATSKSRSKRITRIKRRALLTSMVTLIVMVAAVIAATPTTIPLNNMTNPEMMMIRSAEVKMKDVLVALNKSTGWVNSYPIKPKDLQGKVVLIDFCTYTCINWIRTVPYVRAWSEKYKDQGLVVIGIHTPEFAFEYDLKNVRREISNMNVGYPIATDNNYAIWQAFDNNYWPALYLIDANGRVRHHQFGEGSYEQIEKVIQQLLIEAGSNTVEQELVNVKGMGIEAAPDWSSLKSTENYIGYERTKGFSSFGGARHGTSRAYTLPPELQLNQWALSGSWTFENQSILLNKVNGRLVYRFHSRDLHMVMGSSDGDKSIRFRILIDGKPPGPAHGGDVDDQGYGLIKAQRLYQLIRQPAPIIEREIEIEFFDTDVEVFSFTFG